MLRRNRITQILSAILCIILLAPFDSVADVKVLVTYDYDAFGNLIHSTGSTPNNYLFASEQFDPDLGLYYNRARYLNVSTGRFWSMDSFEGDRFAPPTLHKYAYAGSDPINRYDRDGRQASVDALGAELVGQIVEAIPLVVAITELCVVEYQLGGDTCFDREDRQRTFYHGTNAYVAEVIVSEQRVDPQALAEEGTTASDFGLGFYMSEQLSTAQYYADWRGLKGRNGGPGIVRIEISNHKWRWLVTAGAIDSSVVSGLPGQTQAFVPIYLIDVFNSMNPRFSLAN